MPTKHIGARGVEHGLGGPGPLLLYGFGAALCAIGGLVAVLLLVRLRARRS